MLRLLRVELVHDSKLPVIKLPSLCSLAMNFRHCKLLRFNLPQSVILTDPERVTSVYQSKSWGALTAAKHWYNSRRRVVFSKPCIGAVEGRATNALMNNVRLHVRALINFKVSIEVPIFDPIQRLHLAALLTLL